MFHVTTSELHVWVEVLFPVYGWLAFEPTPNRTNPMANAYQNPSVSLPAGDRGMSGRSGRRWRRDTRRRSGAAAGLPASAGEPGAPRVLHRRRAATAPPDRGRRRQRRASLRDSSILFLLGRRRRGGAGHPAAPCAAPPVPDAPGRPRAAGAHPGDVRRVHGARRGPGSSEGSGRDAPGVPVAARRRRDDHGRPPRPAHVDRRTGRLRSLRSRSAPTVATRRRKRRRRCCTTCAIGRRSDERIAGQYRIRR